MFEQLLAEVFKRLNSSRRAVFKQVFEQRLNVKPGALFLRRSVACCARVAMLACAHLDLLFPTLAHTWVFSFSGQT